MAKKLGVFQTQEQVIQALQQLEQAGFVPGEIKVFAKDSEHSRRVEAESRVHVDEISEMREEFGAQTAANSTEGMSDFGFASLAGGYGLAGSGMTSTAGGGFLFVPFAIGADDHESVLQELGLEPPEAKLCSDALASGSLVISVQAGDGRSLLEQDGGPDLSRLGKAEAIFRGCGAETIAEGA